MPPSCPAPAQEEQTHSTVPQPVTSVSSPSQTEAVVLRYAGHLLRMLLLPVLAKALAHAWQGGQSVRCFFSVHAGQLL